MPSPSPASGYRYSLGSVDMGLQSTLLVEKGESSREIMVSIFIGALAATIRSHPTGKVLGLQQLFAPAVVTPGGWGDGRGARVSG